MSHFSISSATLGFTSSYTVSPQFSASKVLSALGTALAASDLDTAKQKVSAMKQGLLAALQTTGNSTLALARISSRLYSVSKALDSGNVTAAQAAFTSLQNSYTSFQSVTPSLNGIPDEPPVVPVVTTDTTSVDTTSPTDSLLAAYATSSVYSVDASGTVQTPDSTTGSQYSATA